MSTQSRRQLSKELEAAVMRWQDAVQAFDEAAGKRLDLNSAERRCLTFILHKPQTAGAIARAVGLTTGAVTALVDRLEAKGWVTRQRDSKDRRRVQVAITQDALESAMRLYGPLAREGAALLRRFDTTELETLHRFFVSAIELQERHFAALMQNSPVLDTEPVTGLGE